MKKLIFFILYLTIGLQQSHCQNPFYITEWEQHKSYIVKEALKTEDKILSLALVKRKDIKRFLKNFARFKDVENLVFMPGSVKSVPEEIADLKNLRACVISHHSKIDYQTSLQAVSKVSSLMKLSLPGLDQIPDGIKLFRQIHYLDLSHGRFATLPAFFSELTVSTLDLRLGKNLTEEGLVPLSKNKSIENLSLHSCSLNNFPDGLQHMVSLRYLDMSENNISALTCHANGERANLLKDLIIYRNPITSFDDAFFTSCFPALEQITMTDIGETNTERKKQVIENISERYLAVKVF